MKRHVYSEINFHITWHTKDNHRAITTALEDRLYRFIHHRVVRTPGAYLHAIGGVEDHVHLAVTVPPTLLVSDWIGELKGASAYHVNRRLPTPQRLVWQPGYGIVSFGTRDLPWVVRYIENQKQHHASGRTVERLERCNVEVDTQPASG
jgi:putative transposase